MKDWKYYYKIDPIENRPVRSNMLYTPMINPEENVFCMHWDPYNEYQTKHGPRENFTPELIDYFFNREIENLKIFRRFSWAPNILEIDNDERKIYFEWPGETCNNIVYGGRSLDQECPSWQQQLYSIVDDIFNMGYYKPSLYPHCFYIDNQGLMRTIDFYACVPRSSPYIKFDLIRGMIGPNSLERFNEAMCGDEVNVEILFKRALEHYIKWPDDALYKIYQRMFS